MFFYFIYFDAFMCYTKKIKGCEKYVFCICSITLQFSKTAMCVCEQNSHYVALITYLSSSICALIIM